MLRSSFTVLCKSYRLPCIRISARSVGTLTEKSDKKDNNFTLKTPKGTRDYNDKEMAVRTELFKKITRVFEKHGAVTIDTPVFEMRNILAGKYGEDSKLIYDLADQGGDECSLRYDLTVPFARYIAMQQKQAQQMKRYQIAKVYRRDQPAMTKGRLREFYQCDFDIAGIYDPMIPDAEVLKILCDALDAVDVGSFYIKLNHRHLLDGIFEVCGVPNENIRPISSAVDKLDKLPWDQVKDEMVKEKGLNSQIADRIGHYVQLKKNTTAELIDSLEADKAIMSNTRAAKGIADIKLLLEYLSIFRVDDRVKLDLSLARGLDYYTGVIYEAVQNQSQGVGSIAAGGRYDNLVGMFSGKNKNGTPKTIPCVGVSIGVERVFSLLMAKQKMESIKSSATQVYIISVGDGLLKERMELVRELWDAGINASFMLKNKPKLDKQWAVCDKEQIPLAVIIGKDELDQHQIRIKDMRSKDEEQQGGILCDRNDMVTTLASKIKAFSS